MLKCSLKEKGQARMGNLHLHTLYTQRKRLWWKL